MRKQSNLSILLYAFALLPISSCSGIKELSASLTTPKGFLAYDKNIQIENANDTPFAEEIQKSLPQLVDSLEIKLNCTLNPTLFICSTNESFCKYSGARFPGPRAKVTAKGLFISPRLQGSADWRAIVYHELVHVALFQSSGTWHYYTIPLWFHEGLATYMSSGGGSGDVGDSVAIQAIVSGKHFYPHAGFVRSYFSNDHLSPWMAYRQYMVFIKFLNEGREDTFKNLLNSLYSKMSFSKSIQEAYGEPVSVLWQEFLEQLKEK